MGRNEGRVGQDINAATRKIEAAFTTAIQAAFTIGQEIGQLLHSIRENQIKRQGGAAAAMTNTPDDENPSMRKSVASGLEQGLETLSQKNVELQKSLDQLRTLPGSLPRGSVQRLSRQLDALDSTIQDTSEQNRKLSTALARDALMNGHLPPLSTDRRARAVNVMDRTLAATAAMPRPTPEQQSRLTEANMKTAFLGHRLTATSKEKAEELQMSLNQTLGGLAGQVRQLRIPAPPQPSGAPEVKADETSQFKKKL